MTDHPDAATARTAIDALSRGDMTAMLELVDDEVVWHAPGTNRFSGRFDGAASVTAGGWTDGTCTAGVMAFLTLAGTGITTYTLPVSVSVVVMSRTTVPLRRSTIFPA